MISVIIVNYNAGASLLECVRSVLLSNAEVEVIVSDNGSSDRSIELLQETISDSRLKVLENNANLGFSKGNNRGLKLAKGEYLLFLNPDCVIKPDTLSNLMTIFQSDKNIGMMGCLITNADGTEQQGCRRTIPTPGKSLMRALGLSKIWPKLFKDFVLHTQPLPQSPIEVDAISGAFMLVSRLALEDVGTLDEGYFLHCEDMDWCMRFRQKGYKILFVPTTSILHHKGVCSTGRPFFVNWHMHRGMIRFYNKFFRQQYSILMTMLVMTGIALRLIATSLIYSVRKAFSSKAYEQ